jgi:hypothetical protein
MATKPPKQPDPFDAHLEAAKKVAREFFRKNHRIFSVETTDGGTVINAFGGFWQWHIDRQHRRIYEISKQVPDEPPKTSLDPDFTLFVRSRTGIRDKLFRWSQEAMELYLENLDAATHGVVYVRQKMMLKVPFLVSANEMMSRQKRVAKAAMLVLYSCWGKGVKLPHAFGMLGKVLWSQLDPEVCKYAVMLNGRHVTALDYNLVWANLEEVRKIAAATPGILPVWRAISLDQIQKTGVYARPNIVQDTMSHLSTEFGEGFGLTKRGWKWLSHATPLWVQHLLKTFPHVKKESTAWYADADQDVLCHQITMLPAALDFLAAVNERPKFTVFHHAMKALHRVRRTKELVAMTRAAFAASHKHPAKTFWRQQASLTLDWITQGDLRLDANQLKADWGWFMRRQEAWHREVAMAENMKRANTQWPSVLGEFQHKEYLVVPLTTAYDLHVEGKVMHHCVGGYSKYCENGTGRIFSIRQNGASMATFELRRESLSQSDIAALPPGVSAYEEGSEDKWEFKDFRVAWRVAQCRGPCNVDVPHLSPIADLTAAEYGKECMKLPPKERFFAVIRPGFVTLSGPREGDEEAAEVNAVADQVEAAGDDDFAELIRNGDVQVEPYLAGQNPEAEEAFRIRDNAVAVDAGPDADELQPPARLAE